MKKSILYFPAIPIVLFLLNSFVLKEKEAGEKTTAGLKSFKDLWPGDKSSLDPSSYFLELF